MVYLVDIITEENFIEQNNKFNSDSISSNIRFAKTKGLLKATNELTDNLKENSTVDTWGKWSEFSPTWVIALTKRR